MQKMFIKIKEHVALVSDSPSLRGFTFVEIVVVLGIFAAISSVVLFNFKDFSGGVSLQNLSQEIALQISNMQRSSLAGRQPFSLATGNAPIVIGQNGGAWKPSYGICVTSRATGCSLQGAYGPDDTVTAFTLFADDLNDKIFSGLPERLDVIQISGGDYIADVCVDEATLGLGNGSCGQQVQQVIIVFERPNVSPEIRYGGSWAGSASDVTIKISDGNGLSREIVVWKSGQIEVN